MSRQQRSRLFVAVTAALSGILFGVGLGISGMSRPAKVLAFLDVAGDWDPSLAFVMMGAVGVNALAVALAKRRPSAVTGSIFHWPAATAVDAPLLAGAVLFGIGWGLGGYCPGPAVLSVASGSVTAIVFVVAMMVGMIVQHASIARASARTS